MRERDFIVPAPFRYCAAPDPVTIPPELPPERDPGVVDVTTETWPDNVAEFRKGIERRRRNRNRTPRSPEPPEAA